MVLEKDGYKGMLSDPQRAEVIEELYEVLSQESRALLDLLIADLNAWRVASTDVLRVLVKERLAYQSDINTVKRV